MKKEKQTYCGSLPDSVGFSSFKTGNVPNHTKTKPEDYGEVMTDQYGRPYLQTKVGRIYGTNTKVY